LLSTFPISQVVHLRTVVASKDAFLCLNPVSAHTVCLAWYIVKERCFLFEAGCVFYVIRALGQDPFGSFLLPAQCLNRRHQQLTTAANYNHRRTACKIFLLIQDRLIIF
jgi:hypothetical protein